MLDERQWARDPSPSSHAEELLRAPPVDAFFAAPATERSELRLGFAHVSGAPAYRALATLGRKEMCGIE